MGGQTAQKPGGVAAASKGGVDKHRRLRDGLRLGRLTCSVGRTEQSVDCFTQ
jgi:hypothetical protein